MIISLIYSLSVVVDVPSIQHFWTFEPYITVLVQVIVEFSFYICCVYFKLTVKIQLKKRFKG